MLKTVTWESLVIPTAEVADFLTRVNFQPGQFHLLNEGWSQTRIVYVKKEE